MSPSTELTGLSLKVGALGENDRLITILSEEEGITRLAVPGARRPRSSLAATAPLTLLKLEVGGRSGLKRVRQIKVIHSFSKVGRELENLAAAQAILELTMLLVANNDPLPGMLSTVLIHLTRLEEIKINKKLNRITTLAKSVQSCIHLLALGGYGIPIQDCCLTGKALNPPIGEWDWRCSLLVNEGFAIGSIPNSEIQLNPSELALLQRLLRPDLPFSSSGKLMGPIEVWLKLLTVVQSWINNHLHKNISALKMLQEILLTQLD